MSPEASFEELLARNRRGDRDVRVRGLDGLGAAWAVLRLAQVRRS